MVVYANTSAAVKARADWVVTSSIALPIVRHLREQERKIIFAPDKHLGAYIERETGADMLLRQGSCVVHDEFKGTELERMREAHPRARILVHPESPAAVIALADVVGSTSQLLRAASELGAPEFIVATDRGLLHQMRRASPDRVFLEAPTAGESATCKSCAHCPWMAMNGLGGLARALEHGHNEIFVEPHLVERARIPIERMLDFARQRGMRPARGALRENGQLTPGIGAA